MTSNEIDISVIIPIYNGKAYIQQLYNNISCLTSRYRIEFLFVDDGSDDESLLMLKELEIKDERIRCFKKENGGIASARNYGLEIATGTYICFWDQDDTVTQDIFELFMEDFEETGADFIHAGSVANRNAEYEDDDINRKKSIKMIRRSEEEYQYYVRATVMRGLSRHSEYCVSCNIWSCMFRRDFLRRNNIHFIRFLDYEDDLIFMIQAVQKAESFALDTRTVYIWNVNIMSESHNRIKKDRYIPNFYNRFKRFETFMTNAIDQGKTEKEEKERFERELQKSLLLWGLSNETGRGIQGRNSEKREMYMWNTSGD